MAPRLTRPAANVRPMVPGTDWNPVLRGRVRAALLERAAGLRRRRALSAHDVYPPHDEVFAALHADAVVAGQGPDPRTGPVPRSRPGARSVLLGPRHGVARPAVAAEHPQGARRATSASIAPSHGDLTTWARPRRAAAQHHAHRARRPGRLAPGPRLGALHRPGHPRRRRAARAGRVHPLGQRRRAQEGAARRHRPTHRHRVARTRHRCPRTAASSGAARSRAADAALEAAGRGAVDWRIPEH